MLLAVVIRLYQRWLTRYTRACPNTPSCSAYGLRAAQLHGSLRGGAMAWRRIGACGAIAYAMRGGLGGDDCSESKAECGF